MRLTFSAELSATRAQPGSCSRKQISDHLSVCTGVDSSWAQRVPNLHQDVLSSEVPPIPQADLPAIMLKVDGFPPLGSDSGSVHPLR